MKKFVAAIAAILFIVLVNPAEARHHRYHHRIHHYNPQTAVADANGNGIHWTDSALGKIRIAGDWENKIKGFIADVKARGFNGPVHCYANGGHVRGSLHYSGHACDFAQQRRGKTDPVMYHVADLASKWGVRDGCTFRDCGHIDTGSQLSARRHQTRLAYGSRNRVREARATFQPVGLRDQYY